MLQRKKPLARKRPLGASAPPRSANRDLADRACDAVWQVLSDHRIAGCGFCRDERLGPYRIDFLCPGARAAVLVDADPESPRAIWLQDAGYRVFVFAPETVVYQPLSVLDALDEAYTLRIARPAKFPKPAS